MDLIFIRHAQSANNVNAARLLRKYNGNEKDKEMIKERETLRSDDAELSELGKQQAKNLANNFFKKLENDDKDLTNYLFVSSPMRRALDTISPTLSMFKIPKNRVLCYGEFYETGGCYYFNESRPGRGCDVIEKKYKITCVDVPAEGWFAGRKTPETFWQSLERTERVHNWIKSLVKKYHSTYHTAVFIGHGSFLNLLMSSFAKTPISRRVMFVHNNTGITKVRYSLKHGIQFLQLNSTGHIATNYLSGGSKEDDWRAMTGYVVISRIENLPTCDAKLYISTIGHRAKYLWNTETETMLNNNIRKDDSVVHFVAYLFGKLIGMVQYDKECNIMRQILVLPEWRRGHVGAQLVSSVKKEVLQNKQNTLSVDARISSCNFFKSQGFQVDGPPYYRNGVMYQKMKMQLIESTSTLTKVKTTTTTTAIHNETEDAKSIENGNRKKQRVI